MSESSVRVCDNCERCGKWATVDDSNICGKCRDVERLRSERDTARAQVERLKGVIDNGQAYTREVESNRAELSEMVFSLRAQVEEARRERDAAREQLEKYRVVTYAEGVTFTLEEFWQAWRGCNGAIADAGTIPGPEHPRDVEDAIRALTAERDKWESQARSTEMTNEILNASLDAMRLRWTRGFPTVPGFYFHRTNPSNVWPLLIRKDGDRLVAQFDEHDTESYPGETFDRTDGEWAGPIPLPLPDDGATGGKESGE
jgi:hypothetical protein